MFTQYAQQLFLLAIFFMFTFAVVEIIKHFVISFPNKWGKVFKEGFNKKINRWISFAVAYGLAYVFDFKFADMIFNATNGGRASLSQHVNYFLVACLLFVGAKWIHKKIKLVYSGLSEDEK